MKLEINTQERKIRLLEEVNIGELFTFLEEILPDLKWREYSIEGNVVYDVSNPIVINPTPSFVPYTPNPITNPWVTYCTSNGKDVPGIGGTSFTISPISYTGEAK